MILRRWAILFRSDNHLMGKREHLVCEPDRVERVVMFETRREARKYIDAKYAYLRTRPDLRAEPHGWKLPRIVRVKVRVETE